jgi:hypothetical protein
MSKQGKKRAMSSSLWHMWCPEGCWIAVYRYTEGYRQFILGAETGEETLAIWGNPIFNSLKWGSDEVFLNHCSMFNEHELNIWRWYDNE